RDARRRRAVRARAGARRQRAVAEGGERVLLAAARRLARLLRRLPLPRLPRGEPRRRPWADARAGRGGDLAPPLADRRERDRDVRRLLAAARRARPLVPHRCRAGAW